MTPLSEILRDEIIRTGPILFSRFMETALYHPGLGYYMRSRDPFGREGDFFTAEQLQPVFGRLIARYMRLQSIERVLELGAGRGDMAPQLSAFDYEGVDVNRGALPPAFDGAVFANEFFDALPVDIVAARGRQLRRVRIGWSDDRFVEVDAEPASAAECAYLGDAAGELADGCRLEVNLRAVEWMERIAASLRSGVVLIIDYGFTRREAVRFPQGTLMAYRRHQAVEDVLTDPGDHDITSHVAFSALEAAAVRSGMQVVRYESMASLLLRVGEADQFASALAAANDRESLRLRMQLKTLLFGMGETFRVLELRP